MKRIVILSAVIILFACNSKQNKVEQILVSSIDNVQASVADAHNARTSLDYQGTYTGILPSASGSITKVTIVLDDSLFTKDIEYTDKSSMPYSSKGKYEWNAAGNTITLVGEEKPNQYFVGENTLTQMDTEGNKITGAKEGDYILRK